KTAHKPLIVHPNSKPPARDPWFGYFKHGGADRPTLADERVVHRDSFRREIFSKLAVLKGSAELFFPPPHIFHRVRIHRFIGPPCALRSAWSSPSRFTPRAAIRPATGDFQMALLAGRPLYSNSRTVPTLTDRTLATLVAIGSSPSRLLPRLHELA